MSIRLEDGQQVLRLFPSQAAAEKAAGRRLGELAAKQHDSGLGWLLMNEQTGQRYDDAGLIPEASESAVTNQVQETAQEHAAKCRITSSSARARLEKMVTAGTATKAEAVRNGTRVVVYTYTPKS